MTCYRTNLGQMSNLETVRKINIFQKEPDTGLKLFHVPNKPPTEYFFLPKVLLLYFSFTRNNEGWDSLVLYYITQAF